MPLRSGLALALVVSLAGASPAANEPIVRLAKAVEEGDVAAVRRLIAEGADPNERVPSSDEGRTPLFLAVEADHPEVTAALLKAGADPSIEDENGDPVIFMATDAGLIPHARLLVAHGVSINSRNREGGTVLMRGMMHVDPPDFQAKIDLGADVNLVDPRGDSALMMAAEAGNLAAVKTFIDAGAKLDLRNRQGRTALMFAASRDAYSDERGVTPRIVELLIKGGADLNQRDEAGRSALMLALESWTVKQETLDVLLAAKPDPGFRDADGRDALFLAVQDEDRKACVEPLIQLGADIKTSDLEGVDLLMLAAANADPGLVRDFLERGLSPERRSKAGEMAVHLAARSPGPREDDPFAGEADEGGDHGKRVAEVLRLLHEKGATLTATDGNGATPLHLAAAEGTPEAVAFLLPHFSDPDLTDAEQATPLHHAAEGGSVVVLDLLLARSPKLEAKDAASQTPLWKASTVGRLEAVKRLVKAGANVDAPDSDGVTALANALDHELLDTARLLLELGADTKAITDPSARLLKAARQFHERPLKKADYVFSVELFARLADDIERRDADGMTALMWTSASDILPAIEAVLNRSPDVNARSPDGRTALMWAGSSGALDAMKALRAAGADGSLRDPSGRSAADWLAWCTAEEPPSGAGNPDGQEPLLERILRSRRQTLATYLKSARWGADDRVCGTGPLHLAAALGDTDAIEALLKLGAPPNQIAAGGATPLIEAASNGHANALEVLLKHGADPTIRDADKRRAIDQAIHLAQPDVARILLRQEKPLFKDESELLVALVHRGDAELLRDFLKAGASVPKEGEVADEDSIFEGRGRAYGPGAPLEAAASRPDPEILRLLMEFPSATGASRPGLLVAALHRAAESGRLANARFLIEDAKVDPDSLLESSSGGVIRIDGSSEKDRPDFVKGYSALSRALEEEHHEVVAYLVERGVAITGRTRGGEPPLIFAILHSQPEMLQLFLDRKAPVGLVDFDGETALHHAARLNNEAAVRLLLKHGADAATKSDAGLTPLDVARKEQAKAVIAVLEELGK